MSRFLRRRRSGSHILFGFSDADNLQTEAERYNVYRHKYQNWAAKTEKMLYPDYKEQYLVNPLATLLVDYLTARLGRFELAGVNEGEVTRARAIIAEIGFMHNWYQTTHQNVLNGTGIMVKNDVKGRFRRTETSQWNITRDQKTGAVSYTLAEKTESGQPFKTEWPAADVANKDIAAFRLMELPDRPEGISLMRSSLPGLAALHELIFKDLPAGVHNFLSLERIMQLPLDGYNTEPEQQTLFTAMRDKWANRDPSGIGITILDEKVKIGYMGTMDGGRTGQRVLEIHAFIEPILSAVMMNYLMPLGLLLQTGANKSLLRRQQMEANLRLEILRRRQEEQLYLQIWPDLGFDPAKVWIVWPKSDSERMDEWTLHREMYERCLISKEYLLGQYGITDTGTTFFEGIPGSVGEGSGETENEEDTDTQGDSRNTDA